MGGSLCDVGVLAITAGSLPGDKPMVQVSRIALDSSLKMNYIRSMYLSKKYIYIRSM
jgi:hypothetical protein